MRVPEWGWDWGRAGEIRAGVGGVGGRGRGRMPRPPPHLARRGHGLALAPRPPRRGLPARPLRPDAAAGGESTQSLTLSLGNGCRKVPAAAISPSSRGVPGALLRPATAPGELWGRLWSAQYSPPRGAGPAHPCSAQPGLGLTALAKLAPPHPRSPRPRPTQERGSSPSATRPYRPSLRTTHRGPQLRCACARPIPTPSPPPAPGSPVPPRTCPALSLGLCPLVHRWGSQMEGPDGGQ